MSNTDPQRWVPPSAVQRLQAAQGAAGDRTLFTSDLSVNEFVLVHQAGFDPVGLVVGSSVYHIGIQTARWNQSQELGVLSQAMYHARELAMSRMEVEADALGADGVVGVRLGLAGIGGEVEGGDMAEFIAIGTAVKHRGGAPMRAPTGKPFSSDLSGQDFFTLLQFGFVPTALVYGVCVYHVAHQTLRQTLRQVGQNVELPLYTQAIYDAREIAMARMQHEAAQSGATGMVGVRIREESHVWGYHAIEFLALGTAIRAVDANRMMPPPPLVLPLT